MPVKLQVTMTIPGKEPKNFEYELEEERITIGRDQSNDIQVPLSTVSRTHCVLFLDKGEWFIEDLKSTHGTRHNGKALGAGGKKLLRDGDTIELIHFVIQFYAPSVVSPDYSVEKTEALARRMVDEILNQIGRDGEQVPYLRVMNGPDEGKKFSIGAEITEVFIGRGSDCDFQVNDVNISRRHAVIRRNWNDIIVEDDGSKNGVLINDRRIQKATALRHADELLMGAVKLTFIDPSAKFIGQLDDIPAFASGTSTDRDALDDQPADDEDPPDDDAPVPAALPSMDAPPRSFGGARTDAAPDIGAEAHARIEAGPDVAEPERDPFDDDDDQPRRSGLGKIEIGLIVGAVAMVVSGS
jgi:pSer/pThr/pTyr-binding forkhead associated (FHA) protein